MLLFPVIYILIFCYVPMGGILIAFKDYSFRKGIMGSEWVGLKYFKQFFHNPDIVKIIKNTLIISFYQLLVSFPAPIILALALHIVGNDKFKKVMQTVTYAPYFISTVVLVGIVLQCLHLNIGVVNTILDMLGMQRVVLWEKRPILDTFMYGRAYGREPVFPQSFTSRPWEMWISRLWKRP